MEFLFNPEGTSGEETIKQMATMRPTTNFGETFQYSNHLVAAGGFAAANIYQKSGTLLEKYENAMKKLIFEPLQMQNTFVKLESTFQASHASPHAFDLENQIKPIDQAIDDFVYPIAPAGSIWSNIEDIAKYISLELNSGRDSKGKQIFSEEQINFRRIPGVQVNENSYYGLGLFIELFKGIPLLGHGGNTFGFTSDMFFLPEHNLGVVVLTNAGSANHFRNIIRQKLFEIFFDAEEKSSDLVTFSIAQMSEANKKLKEKLSSYAKEPTLLDEFIGTYHNPDLGKIIIKKVKTKYFIITNRWSSEIVSLQEEENGSKSFTPVNAPWSGTFFSFLLETTPKKQIILNKGQIKYIFL